MYTYPTCIHIWMECKSFFGKYGNLEIVFFWRRKKNWWSTCFCLVMEVTTQNSYFKFWILHGVGVGNGLNNNFLHFPPIFFAILDDFSKSEHTKKKIILQIFKAPFNSLLGLISGTSKSWISYHYTCYHGPILDRSNCVWHFDIFAKIYNEKNGLILKYFLKTTFLSAPFSTSIIS